MYHPSTSLDFGYIPKDSVTWSFHAPGGRLSFAIQAESELMKTKPILVTGATGKVGSRVVARLTAQGHLVRGVSRASNPRFDWTLPQTWAAALDGVRSAYVAFSPDLAMPGADAVIGAFVAAAKAAAVEHLVLLSGRGETRAQHCERIVQQSGLRWHIVRCSWFYQNFTEGMLHQGVCDGSLALPAGAIADPMVDAEDIADVVVSALTDDRPNTVYEVTGPDLLTFAQVAQELSRATQRPVTYLPVSADVFHSAVSDAHGPELADLLTSVCAEVFSGHNQWLGDGVLRATGRPPRAFSDFCSEAARAGSWGAP